jgi:hypothetical protein
MPNEDTKAGVVVLTCILVGLSAIVFAYLYVESRHQEQGPPKWRHFHYQANIPVPCDDQTCAPKGAFDE